MDGCHFYDESESRDSNQHPRELALLCLYIYWKLLELLEPENYQGEHSTQCAMQTIAVAGVSCPGCR